MNLIEREVAAERHLHRHMSRLQALKHSRQTGCLHRYRDMQLMLHVRMEMAGSEDLAAGQMKYIKSDTAAV